jgi:O-antigen ligase
MMKRMQNLLWYVFVFLLPWQTVWIVHEVFVVGEKWQYATLGLYASDVALLLFVVLFCFSASREVWREIGRDIFVWIFAALVVWSLLSIMWAIEWELAFFSVWRILLAMLAYVCVRYGGASLRKTLSVFLVSMTLQAGLALSQWVSQFVFASSLLGIAEHDPSRWGTFVLKTESGRFLRAYGGFEHPNVLGGVLTLATLFGVWLSVTTKRFGLRIIFLAMTVLASFALVFTFSRSAWMGLGAGVGMVVLNAVRDFFSKKLLLKKKLSGVFFAVSVAIFSFCVGFFLVRDIAMSRFSEETLVREGSFSDRRVFLEESFVAIREYPIFGVGGGNFTAFTQAHFPESGNFVGDFQPVHMVPILVFAELGVVGFVLFVSLFVFAFLRAWQEKNVFAGMILCVLLPLLFLDHFLWSGHFGTAFLVFLFGIIALSFSISKTLKQESE